ncbi:MAG: tetratricopeptide repeat protein, partial [Myxococcota bacterium]
MRLPRTDLAAVCIALGLVAASPVRASSIETRLEVFDREAVAIARVVDDLRGQVAPTAILGPREAAQRFDEAMFMHMVGEPARAAEQLYTLLSTGSLTDAAMRRDAEWTYAEALLAMGNLHGAGERFAQITRDRNHPFHGDAVRELLGVYATVGDREAFEALYEREIVSGRVEPTGRILYALGKGRYQVGDLDGAARAFDTVRGDDPYASRAQYFLGVVATRQGELLRATRAFETVAARPVVEPLDQQIHDRAQLALGRLHYHSGNYADASKHYAAVSPESDLLDDKLYEMIWSSIRQERWPEAIHNVEVFLMVFPDHEYAAQLLLLRGHLHVQAEDWDAALTTYEKVIRDYRPVHDRFHSLAQPGSSAEAEVREVVEQLDGAAGLPAYAVSMMREDPLFMRAISVFEDLDAQRQVLDASERLVEDLSVFLRADGLGSFSSMRVQALHHRAQIVEQRLGLLEVQEQWLAAQPSMSVELVEELKRRRIALEVDLAGPLQAMEDARAAM